MAAKPTPTPLRLVLRQRSFGHAATSSRCSNSLPFFIWQHCAILPRNFGLVPNFGSLNIDPNLRQKLEEDLAALNQKILDAHESFGAIKEQLGNTGKMVSIAKNDPISIEAIPSKVFDILSRTQVMITSTTGAHLPIGRHGEGTQS